jgi:hypothetical protein
MPRSDLIRFRSQECIMKKINNIFKDKSEGSKIQSVHLPIKMMGLSARQIRHTVIEIDYWMDNQI